jgi:hypothetical protein
MAEIQFFIDFALWRGLGMNKDNESLQFCEQLELG